MWRKIRRTIPPAKEVLLCLLGSGFGPSQSRISFNYDTEKDKRGQLKSKGSVGAYNSRVSVGEKLFRLRTAP